MKEHVKEAKKRKNNMKLYPIYEMIGLDLLFYYSIKVLFLTQVKGISDANVVLLSSFYACFSIFLQIPCLIICDKIGKQKTILSGNIINSLSVLVLILFYRFPMMVISEFLSAIAFGLKNVSERSLLTTSIPKSNNKNKIFSKIHGKAYSKYQYICAITGMLSGYLYDYNPYIPVVLCLLGLILAVVLSSRFIEIEKKDTKTENKKINEYIRDVKEGFKFIFNSERLKSLLLMIGFIWGLLCLYSTYQTTLFKKLGMSATFIGIVAALTQILCGISSKSSNKFNKKYSNKTLKMIVLPMTIGAIIAGSVTYTNIPFDAIIAIILITCFLRFFMKGKFQVLRNVYVNSFTNSEILTKIYSAETILCNVMRMAISMIGSFVLAKVNIQIAMIITGGLYTIIAILILLYMKPRVGLKPEEYSEKDIIKE